MAAALVQSGMSLPTEAPVQQAQFQTAAPLNTMSGSSLASIVSHPSQMNPLDLPGAQIGVGEQDAASASQQPAQPQMTLAPALHGLVAVVGSLFKGGELSCGGSYAPDEKVVFHPTLACGSTVRLYNPATQQSTNAKVVNQAVMFRSGVDRIADISPAAAAAIGMDENASLAQALYVQPLKTGQESIVVTFPTKAPVLDKSSTVASEDLDVLTRNLVAECGNCGTLGMLAVARVTVNRASMAFGGANTIRKVVYAPNQFSWVKHGPTPSARHAAWSEARELAEATLNDQISGKGLGLFYRMGRDADHFYAAAIPVPSWASRMSRIDFTSDFERDTLRHRYFASGKFALASR